jgi:two-component system, OmpR family, sensor histidine kinase ArlS
MKIEWKNSFILKKFRISIIVVFLVTFVILSLISFFISKNIIQSQVKSDLTKQFMGVNNSIITQGSNRITPITSGILEENEIVYVIKEGAVLYKPKMQNEQVNDRNLDLVIAKSPNGNNLIEVKLYVNMEKRVNRYFSVIYIFLIPLMFILGLIIVLSSLFIMKKFTRKLYMVIENVKDFDSHGIDFNKIKTYSTGEEAGILSREFDKLSSEIVRLRHKERQFVNDAAHELRTPLAIIEGNLSIMDKKSYTEEGKNVARELIRNSLYSAKALIEDMLDLNQEEIIVKEKLTQENITEILTEVLEDYKKIYSDFIFKADFEEVSYPIRKLDFVKLINIIMENAVKYSTEELKEIEVKLKSKGKKYYLSVTDYGIGMTRENVELVFDKFWRADASRARNTGGTGLGLSIAHKICEKYKFNINVASMPNIGTTITIELS